MHEISPQRQGGAVVPSGRATARSTHVETRVVVIPPNVSRADARRMLADEAEYGKWELARVQRFRGGARRVWLRRRAMRVRRTDATYVA
jgi:hypothetical protein